MAGKKKIFNADTMCGAHARQSGKPCTQPKGMRTDHPGQGRCWVHGGRTPIKTGLYSKIKSPTLMAAMKEVEDSGVDLMDLTPEAKLLRALLLDIVQRHEVMKDALLSWHATFLPAMQTLMVSQDPAVLAQTVALLKEQLHARPKEVFNIDAASVLAERVGRMIERIHKMRQTSSVTFETVQLFQERLAMVVWKHLRSNDELLEAIKKDWADIEIPIGFNS